MSVLLYNIIIVVSSRWVDAHQGQLARHGSSLEFKLHQRKFLSLVETCQITQAVAYAKVLGQFTPRHIKGEFN